VVGTGNIRRSFKTLLLSPWLAVLTSLCSRLLGHSFCTKIETSSRYWLVLSFLWSYQGGEVKELSVNLERVWHGRLGRDCLKTSQITGIRA
jgi:hypothetical protein